MTYSSSYADLIVFIIVADGATMEHTPQQLAVAIPNRRKLLPSPEVASGDLGLWSILRKNIGKCVLVVDSSVVNLRLVLCCRKRLVQSFHACVP